MANRVFQSVIYQMKDAIDRVVGVVDETGAVISCSELNLIGEVREGFMAERPDSGRPFCAGWLHLSAVLQRQAQRLRCLRGGADETAGQFAAVLSISLQSIKQYHDEKFDKSNFIKNVVLDNILPGDIYAKAREPALCHRRLHAGTARTRPGFSGMGLFPEREIFCRFCRCYKNRTALQRPRRGNMRPSCAPPSGRSAYTCGAATTKSLRMPSCRSAPRRTMPAPSPPSRQRTPMPRSLSFRTMLTGRRQT